ncbi:MAG TPA: diaminopimelate epimerase, partial [Pirellulaceae bacterium]|nr:diaminopimelate epimerase [Pirellulaceae bacterium]
MSIPYYKAQAVGNDFLFSWISELPEELRKCAEAEFLAGARVKKDEDSPDELARAARAVCHRHLGVGADGWYLMHETPNADLSIHLFNSDGSRAELSGNGTRCAAGVLLWENRPLAEPDRVRVETGSGVKQLRLMSRKDNEFLLEMEMGKPQVAPDEVLTSLPLASGSRDVTILNVGNPQCALAVKDLKFDWRAVGAEIEGHPYFPKRTNVSFFRKVGPKAIEARFYERGAGPTLSSGTGSTGAAAAAILLRMVAPEVEVITEAGSMQLRWENPPEGSIFVDGPAEVIARG